MRNSSLLMALVEVVGEDDAAGDPIQLYSYSVDASAHQGFPEAVVRPESSEEVSKIIQIARTYGVPIVPRGAGTSLCGQSTPILGGIVLDLVKMNRIKEIDYENRYAVVEAGVVYDDLNDRLLENGFLFPPLPASSRACTIGGNVATNASGSKAIKYGATRDYVLGMEAVLPSGEIVRLGSKTVKHSSGYQLAKLFTGSEGTLGVITEITVRVIPAPKFVATCVALFDALETAGEAIKRIVGSGVTPSSLEVMDSYTLKSVKRAIGANIPEAGSLVLVETDGEEEVARKEMQAIRGILQELQVKEVRCSEDAEQREELWKVRKSILPVLSRYAEGIYSVPLIDDLQVPPTKVPETIREIEKSAERNDVIIGTYGHAGDGNLHCKVLIDVTDWDSWVRAFRAAHEIYRKVVEIGGSLSGEHGIGISKAPFAGLEHADGSLELMRAIKNSLDLDNLMNPGKFPDRIPKDFLVNLKYPISGGEKC